MEKKLLRKRYPLHPVDLVSIFSVDWKLSGPESLEDYIRRVNSQTASLLYATALLQNENPYTLSKKLGLSLRQTQRYIKDSCINYSFLTLCYILQVDEPTLSNSISRKDTY